MKPSEFLARARPGHCGTTADVGDCSIGESGSFGEVTARWEKRKLYKDDPTPQMMKQAVRSCLSACKSCTQCNYVSISWYFQDCACPSALNHTTDSLPLRTARHASLVSYTGSWYTACDTEKLQRPPDGNWSHFQSASAFTSLPRTPSIVSNLTWPRSASREKRLALRLPQACTQRAHCVCMACAWRVHGMYLMLRLPQAESRALEWVQPHAAMRVALVLYGKVPAA